MAKTIRNDVQMSAIVTAQPVLEFIGTEHYITLHKPAIILLVPKICDSRRLDLFVHYSV